MLKIGDWGKNDSAAIYLAQ